MEQVYTSSLQIYHGSSFLIPRCLAVFITSAQQIAPYGADGHSYLQNVINAESKLAQSKSYNILIFMYKLHHSIQIQQSVQHVSQHIPGYNHSGHSQQKNTHVLMVLLYFVKILCILQSRCPEFNRQQLSNDINFYDHKLRRIYMHVTQCFQE